MEEAVMKEVIVEALEVGNFELFGDCVSHSADTFTSMRIGSKNYTPFHYACMHGNMTLVQRALGFCPLEALQATFQIKPTPADVALQFGHSDLHQFLEGVFQPSPVTEVLGTKLLPTESSVKSQLPESITHLQPSTNNAISEVPETSPIPLETSTIQPQSSTIQPEISTALPETSAVQPETSTIEPETSAVLPETSAMLPESHTIQPKTSSIQPAKVLGDTKLHEICRKGDLLALKSYISEGLNINLLDENGLAPLHITAKYGHCELIEFLISECHCDVNLTTKLSGMAAIHYASSSGHLNVIKLLALFNAKLDLKDSLECTPLHIAAQEGHLSIVKFFVCEMKLGINTKDLQGNTPLQLALGRENTEVVQYLRSIGESSGTKDLAFGEESTGDTLARNVENSFTGSTDPVGHSVMPLEQEAVSSSHCDSLQGNNSENENSLPLALGGSLIHVACANGDLKKVKELVNRKSCDINGINELGHLPIITASYYGHTEIVRFLISQSDCDITKADNDGRTALHYASLRGHTDVVSILVCEAKCNVMHPDKEGVLPIHLAAFGGHLDTLRLLKGQDCLNIHQADDKGRNALHYASQEGHLYVVKFLLNECQIDPNAMEYVNGVTSLHTAVARGHQAVVECLLSHPNCYCEAVDGSGRTPLYRAAQYGMLSILKILKEKYHCKCTSCDFDQTAPIHAAAFTGNLEIVKYLVLHCEVAPDSLTASGRTALHYAAQAGNLSVVKFLVEVAKSDAFPRDSEHSVTPLHLAANNGRLSTVKFLCSLQANPAMFDQQDKHGRSPLHYAAVEGHTEIVRYLVIEKGCDVDLKDYSGFTPRLLATNSKKSDLIAFLRESRPRKPRNEATNILSEPASGESRNVEAVNLAGIKAGQNKNKKSGISAMARIFAAQGDLKQLQEIVVSHGIQICQGLGLEGETILHVAALNGHLGIVEYLVNECKCTPDINVENHVGHTPLHNAARKGHLKIVQLLASQKDCKNDIANCDGWRTLHYACQIGHYDMVLYLVNVCHCSINVCNKEGATPFQIAASAGHLQVLQFLAKVEGCDKDSCDYKKRTALHHACQKGHFGIVQFLVQDCGCNPSAVDENLLTPLHLAAMSGHLEIVKFLCSLSECIADVFDKHAHTPLFYASQNGHLRVVEYLTNQVKHDTMKQDNRDVPSPKAATLSKVNIANFLDKCKTKVATGNMNNFDQVPSNAYSNDIATGVSNTQRSNRKRLELPTAHQLAIEMHNWSRDLEKLKVAVASFGPDVINARASNGETLIHNACFAGYIDVVNYLILDMKSDITVQDTNGHSPLHYAAHRGHTDVVDVLASYCPGLVISCDIRGRTALHYAAQNGHLNVVKTLIKNHKCNCDMLDQTGLAPLHLAAGKGHIGVVEFLVKEGGANIWMENFDGQTALHVASHKGQLEMVKYFVTNLNASPMVKDSKRGASAVHLAAGFGHCDLVRYMCDLSTFVPSMTDNNGRTPLHYACSHGDLEIVKCLIQHGSKADQVDDQNITPLQLAAMARKAEVVHYLSQTSSPISSEATGSTIALLAAEGNIKKLKEVMLLSASQNAGQIGPDSELPLHISAYQGHLNVVQYFVQLGFDFNVKDDDGDTPLHYAAQNGHLNVLQFLLAQAGIDPNVANKDLRLPLHCASVGNSPKIVEALLPHTASKDAKDIQGSTPLCLAAYFGHVENFKLLLEAGCNLECVDDDGRNALHLACQENHVEIVKILVEKIGTSLCVKDSSRGSTPFHLAASKGSIEVIAVLCSYPQSNPNIEDHDGRIPLHYASQNGHIEVVRLLSTRFGSDAMAKDKNDVTPLSLSAEGGHISVLKYLCSLPNSNPNFRDKHGRTPLHYACQEGHLDIVRYLVEEQAGKVDQKDNNDVTPMDLLQLRNHRTILDYLRKHQLGENFESSNFINSLKNTKEKPNATSDNILLLLYASQGALSLLRSAISKHPSSVNVHGPSGETLLHCASQFGHLDVAEYLVYDCDMDINIEDDDKHTPVCNAAHEGHVALLKFLACRGADLHRKDIHGREPLHYASQNGHLLCVRALVEEYKCDVNVTDKNGVTPILLAAEASEADVFDFLLRQGKANVNLPNNKGRSPLHCASQQGCLPIAKTLLSECQVNCMERDLVHGVTALHLAANNGHLDLVKLLSVQPNCECDVQDFHQHTPLYYAVVEDHYEVAQYLVEVMKCNPHIMDSKGVTPLSLAKSHGQSKMFHFLNKFVNSETPATHSDAGNSNNLDISDQVLNSSSINENLESGDGSGLHLISLASKGNLSLLKAAIESNPAAAANVRGPHGGTLLHQACFAGQLSVVEYLVNEVNGDVNLKDEEGHTPVHNAAHEGHRDVLNFLALQPNCNVNAKDNNHRLPLHYGTQNGHLAVVQLLVEKYKCDVNAEDKTGVTPFQLAAEAGHFNVFEFCLVTGKGNISHQDHNGRNVLHCASQQGSSQIVKLLLQQYKAEVIVRDKVHGVTALHLSAGCDHLEVIKIICSFVKKSPGATCDILDNHGRTPLHYACQEGSLSAVQYFISEQQCNPHLKDQKGITPCHLATLKAHTEIVDYIKTHCSGSRSSTDDGNGGKSQHSMPRGDAWIKAALSQQPEALAVRVLVVEGNITKLKQLVHQHGISILKRMGPQGESVLHNAAAAGHLDIVQYLVQDCCLSVSDVDEDGHTPLHNAVHDGYITVVRFLMGCNDCNVNSKDKNGRMPIHYGAQNGHFDTIKLLILEGKCSYASGDNKGSTPLHLAAFNGHKMIVSFLLSQKNSRADIIDKNGRTPLHCASQEGHTDVVQYLIAEHNADVTLKDLEHKVTALHLAASNGHLDIVKLLCSHQKCDPDAVEKHGRTPLHCACAGGHVSIVKYLVKEKHCDCNRQDEIGFSPAELAAMQGNAELTAVFKQQEKPSGKSLDLPLDRLGKLRRGMKWTEQSGEQELMFRMHVVAGDLEKVKGDIQTGGAQMVRNKGPSGETAVHNAAAAGHFDVVQYLIKVHSCDVNDIDEDGHTPLHLAAHDGYVSIIELLVSQPGCYVNPQDKHKRTPLHYAAQNGHLNAVQFLVEKAKCDVSPVDEKNITPFHLAAGNGKLDIVEYLCSKGCNPHQLDNNGRAGIHHASQEGKLDVIKYLVIQQRSSCTVKDYDHGVTPMHLAAAKGYSDILCFIGSQDECKNAMDMKDNHGRTPLHYACQHGRRDATKLLFTEYHCDPMAKDLNGATPIDLAQRTGHPEIARFLKGGEEMSSDVTEQTAEDRLSRCLQQ